MSTLSFETDDQTGTTWAFSVSFAEYDLEQERCAYDWTVTRDNICLGTSVVDWDSKIRSGCCGKHDNPTPLAEIMRTLFSFLSAWAASMDHADRTGTDGENADLFDSRMVPLLDAFSSDELALFGDEIGGTR